MTIDASLIVGVRLSITVTVDDVGRILMVRVVHYKCC